VIQLLSEKQIIGVTGPPFSCMLYGPYSPFAVDPVKVKVSA